MPSLPFPPLTGCIYHVVSCRRPGQKSYLYFQHFSASLSPAGATLVASAARKDLNQALQPREFTAAGHTLSSTAAFGNELGSVLLWQKGAPGNHHGEL